MTMSAKVASGSQPARQTNRKTDWELASQKITGVWTAKMVMVIIMLMMMCGVGDADDEDDDVNDNNNDDYYDDFVGGEMRFLQRYPTFRRSLATLLTLACSCCCGRLYLASWKCKQSYKIAAHNGSRRKWGFYKRWLRRSLKLYIHIHFYMLYLQ